MTGEHRARGREGEPLRLGAVVIGSTRINFHGHWRRCACVGDQAARGAISGTLAELASGEQRELVGAVVDTTSRAATRGILIALRPDTAYLQELVDRALGSAVDSAVSGAGRHLAADSALRQQLAATTHELSANRGRAELV